MTETQELYDLLRKIGPYRGKTIDLIDNSGPKATHPSYIVHVKGGVSFEVIHDEEGPYFDPGWAGPLPECTPGNVLAWLRIIGVEIGGKRVI